MLIDAHVHIFPKVDGYTGKGRTSSGPMGQFVYGSGEMERVLPAAEEELRYTTEMLLRDMGRGGVDKAVILLDPCYGDWSEYVLDACRRYPDRFTAAGYFDPWAEDAAERYETVLSGPIWKNVKIEFSQNSGLCGVYPGVRLDGRQLDWLWERMEREEKTVAFDLGKPGQPSYQTDAVRHIAKRRPGLKIVLCHAGQPSLEAENDKGLWAAWMDQIRLGQLPNVWFDLSAMPYHVKDRESYPYPSTKRYFSIALDAVGDKKLLWGSDVPWLLGTEAYARLVSHGKRLVEDLPQAAQDRILFQNALDVYWPQSGGNSEDQSRCRYAMDQ